MTPKLWKPILQALALKDYNEDFAGQVIWVCINPPADLLLEILGACIDYTREYESRVADIQKLDPGAIEELTRIKQESSQRINTCFAKLWSLGEDKYSAADLAEYQRTNPSLFKWLLDESAKMIHAQMKDPERWSQSRGNRGKSLLN
jgi:hypothetical protein